MSNSSPYGVQPDQLTNLAGAIYFAGADATSRHCLWQSDGTTAGTRTVAPSKGGPRGLSPRFIRPYKGTLLFCGYYADGRRGLWRSDFTESGTNRILVPNENLAGVAGLAMEGFAELNNELFFGGHNAAHDVSLWKTDGTANGTIEVPFRGGKNIAPRFMVAASLR